MKPGSSISLQRRGKGGYDPVKIEPEPTEVLSFVVCYGDTSGEELQSVRISREQLKDVQKAIGEYLERTEIKDIQSVEAEAEAEVEVDEVVIEKELQKFVSWCSGEGLGLLCWDYQGAKRRIKRYLEETAQEGSPKKEASSVVPTSDSKDVDKKIATLLNLVDWCREMNDAERYDKGVSYEEALVTTKVIKRYILSNNLIEKVPRDSLSKLCVGIESVGLEAPKIRELTEVIQQMKQQLTDTKIKYFRLNPDNVKITKSTCSPRKTSETVVGEGIKMLTFSVFDTHEYFAEITCNLFSLKAGGRSLEEARANLNERFAELTQTLFG